ncbi:MAG: multicopper oxidase domain-containing protein, partial [Nanoarchaeota archaeon]
MLLLITACAPTERLVSQSTIGLPDAHASTEVFLAEGESYDLAATVVKKRIGENEVRMFGYNGQIPGPVLRVKQGSTVRIMFNNNLDMPSAVHWHGIRLDNRYDGVPDVTQPPVNPGASFEYVLRFPDAGVYWYHPHLREDIQQELGLYGAIIVTPDAQGYYGDVDREQVVFLDDIRLTAGQPELFSLQAANYVLMGRFGNTMLTNGVTSYALRAAAGERMRLYLINSANTRTFNFSIEGHDLTVVGGDSGLYAQPFQAQSVILGPSERAIIEMVLKEPGRYALRHTTPESAYTLGVVDVAEGGEPRGLYKAAGHAAVAADIARIMPYVDA